MPGLLQVAIQGGGDRPAGVAPADDLPPAALNLAHVLSVRCGNDVHGESRGERRNQPTDQIETRLFHADGFGCRRLLVGARRHHRCAGKNDRQETAQSGASLILGRYDSIKGWLHAFTLLVRRAIEVRGGEEGKGKGRESAKRWPSVVD
ncbi:MAG TPA: hypothetical protein VLT83_03935 [Opitutaceae bacterium]|nr:hypothetical protein [Opitutaceae bacterium]